MSEIVSAEQIEIVEVSIHSERFQDGKKLYVSGIVPDVQAGANSGIELEIYENIYMPYLTGRILIHDDNDIYRVAELKGTERLTVKFKSPGTPTYIEKVFIISTIERSVKINDQTSELLLELTEDHGYFDQLQLVNKSYNGTGVEIIKKILDDNTNKTIRPRYYKQPSQKSLRYIIPWQTPYDAIRTVVKHMTTDNSLPYFFFSSLTSDDLILTDLESILAREPFYSTPFSYSQAKFAKEKSLEDEVFNIFNVESSNLNDTLSLAKIGAIGASFESIDTLSGADQNIRVNMKQQYETLGNIQILNLSKDRFPIDDKFRVDEKSSKEITEYNSNKFSVLSYTPYDDTNGLVPNYRESRRVTVRNNYIKHLADNSFSITVPGLAFAVKNVNRSVGHQIYIEISKEGSARGDASGVDERRSGAFVMLAKKHVFNLLDKTHNVVIKVGRITEPRRID